MEIPYVVLKFDSLTNKVKVECSRRGSIIYGSAFHGDITAICCHYNSRYYREKYHCYICPVALLFHKNSRK